MHVLISTNTENVPLAQTVVETINGWGVPTFLALPLLIIVAYIAIVIGVGILWKKYWRPRMLERGKPCPTFGNIMNSALRIGFVEDTQSIFPKGKGKKGKKGQEEDADEPRKPLATWSRLNFLLLIATFALAALQMNFFIPLIPLILIVAVRSHNIKQKRNASTMRMFQVANSVFKYGKGANLNPWGYIKTKWENLYYPAQVQITVPPEWRADNMRNRDSFSSHFDSVVSSDNIWQYDWDTPNGIVTAKPVPHLPTKADYPGSNGSWDQIPLGVGISGEISWNLADAPHLLVCGTSGGGKSVLQRNIIFHCIQHADDIKFLGVDLKRVELKPFVKYDESVLGIAVELEDGVEVMRYGRDEMMERYTEMEEKGVNHFRDLPEKKPALLIMVDEAYMFMASSGQKTDEGKANDALHGEATTIIGDIARLGRAAGVHLVLATQRPDAKVIYGEIKENLAGRYMAGRAKSPASLMVLDSDTGTRIPGDIKGRGVISFNGEEQFIQGYFAGLDWIDQWLAANGRAPNGGKANGRTSPNPLEKFLDDEELDFDGIMGSMDLPDEEPASSLPSLEKTPENTTPSTEETTETEPPLRDDMIPLKKPKSLRTLVSEEDYTAPETGTDPEESEVEAPPLPLENEEGNASATPMKTPLSKRPSPPPRPPKPKAPEWDDDLESLFEDIPHNTPKPKEKPARRTLPPLPTRNKS